MDDVGGKNIHQKKGEFLFLFPFIQTKHTNDTNEANEIVSFSFVFTFPLIFS